MNPAVRDRRDDVTGSGLATGRSCRASGVFMDTFVSIESVHSCGACDCPERTARAMGWFRRVEERCSRFDPASELSRLCARPGVSVEVSPLLYGAIEFALAVASASGGAFDPTVGHALERLGFNRNYLTGERTTPWPGTPPHADYHDVVLGPELLSVILRRPLMCDLGAVAKGLAIDLAAQELKGLDGFVIDAGGDLYAGSAGALDEAWLIGIRHPRQGDAMIESLRVSNAAVCTSGDYERPRKDGGGHHIIDPALGLSSSGLASVTVIAPSAMAADALATAAFVLGAEKGIAFLERQGVEGLAISASLERHETPGFGCYRAARGVCEPPMAKQLLLGRRA